MALVGRLERIRAIHSVFMMHLFLELDYKANKAYDLAYEYEKVIQMSRKERTDSGITEQPEEPIRKRFLVSDITPEGLSLIHAQNKRGLCLWVDELSTWFKNFNRHNSLPEEQLLLSIFRCQSNHQ